MISGWRPSAKNGRADALVQMLRGDGASASHATSSEVRGGATASFGLLPRVSSPLAGLKLICVWLLVLLASATASQLIARVARRAGPPA